jgi:hypothetical protein|tara:strand:+ start:63 stop:299 length:237 start_codon:yes stop_codon:yes gene_type:complete
MVSRPKIYEKHPTKNEIRWRYIDEAFDKFSKKLITSDTWNLISEKDYYKLKKGGAEYLNRKERRDFKNDQIKILKGEV